MKLNNITKSIDELKIYNEMIDKEILEHNKSYNIDILKSNLTKLADSIYFIIIFEYNGNISKFEFKKKYSNDSLSIILNGSIFINNRWELIADIPIFDHLKFSKLEFFNNLDNLNDFQYEKIEQFFYTYDLVKTKSFHYYISYMVEEFLLLCDILKISSKNTLDTL